MLKLVWERWKKVPELENVKVSNLDYVNLEEIKINGVSNKDNIVNGVNINALDEIDDTIKIIFQELEK